MKIDAFQQCLSFFFQIWFQNRRARNKKKTGSCMALTTTGKFPLKFPVLDMFDHDDLDLHDTDSYHYHLPYPVKFPTLENPDPDMEGDYCEEDFLDELEQGFPAQSFPAFYELPAPPRVQRVLRLFVGGLQQLLPQFQVWENPKCGWYQSSSHD